MLRPFQLLQLLLPLTILCGWLGGCSPTTKDECSNSRDCKDNEVCKVDPKTKNKVCKPKTTSECETDEDCKPKGANYQCQTDPQTNEKRCIEPCPGVCSADSDCSNCPNGRSFCVAGGCAQKQDPPKCPASCTSNVQCANCPDGLNSCIEGACKKSTQPPQCPSSCTSNTDCTSCPNEQTTCENNVCIKKSACPNLCTSNADCGQCPDNRTACINNQCSPAPQCPSSCTVDGDCATCSDGKTSCVGSICKKPDIPPQCPSSCVANPDCASCTDGRTSCVNNLCTKPSQCPSSCNSNVDCANCTEGKISCENQTCVKPNTTPQCPATCTKDTDCDPCPDGRTSCENNACIKKQQPQCPAICNTDVECASCTGGRTSCINSKCEPKPQCTGFCSVDADCASCTDGKTKCNTSTNVCTNPQQPQCPALCSTNSDCTPCPNGETACVNRKCQKPQSTQCPATCTTNAQCAPCSGGRIACVSGTCQIPSSCPASCTTNAQCTPCGNGFTCQNNKCQIPQGKAGELCNPQAANSCITGHLCISVSSGNTAYCFQDCTNNATLCAANIVNGRTSCIRFAQTTSGQIISVCLKEAKKGDSCSYAGTSQATCQRGQNPPLYCSKLTKCEAAIVQKTAGALCNDSGDNTEPLRICDANLGLTCVQGKCKQNTLVAKYGKCGVSGLACATNLTCTTLSSGAPNGYCLENCTPATPNCTGGATCSALSGGGGVCLPIGNLSEDGVCGGEAANANTIDPNKNCKKGLTCLSFSQDDSRGLCVPRVALCSATVCATGRKCLSLSSGAGVCLKDCAASTTSCPSKTQCDTLGTNKVCTLTPPVGPKAYGETCDTPIDLYGCKQNLTCLVTSQGGQGVCSQSCTTSTTCPSFTQNANTFKGSCIQLQTSSYCLFECGQTGQTCPTGLTCATLQSGKKVCVAQ